MSARVHLDDDSVNAVAERVVQLLRNESVSSALVDAAEVARRFSLSRDYVYEHADKLDAVRIGSGPKARLRFDPARVAEVLTGSRQSESQDTRSSVRSKPGVTLLPIQEESP
jgi:pantoate kinase